jgi:hypothetical protein
MALKFYCGNEFTGNEFEQFQVVKKILAQKFENDPEDVYIIYNFHIKNNQYDVLLIKNEQEFLILEMKDYEGEIYGSENNDWKIKDKNGRITEIKYQGKNNIYNQCRSERATFTKFLIKLRDNENLNLPNKSPNDEIDPIYNIVNVWVFFNGSSEYKDADPENKDVEKINFKANMWFDVVNEKNLPEKLNKIKGVPINNDDIKKIINKLGVDECNSTTASPPPKTEIGRVLEKYKNNSEILDALYQFASNPTAYSTAGLGIYENLEYIEKNLKLRYNEEKAKKCIDVLNKEIIETLIKPYIHLGSPMGGFKNTEPVYKIIDPIYSEIKDYVENKEIYKNIYFENKTKLSPLEHELLKKLRTMLEDEYEVNLPNIYIIFSNSEKDKLDITREAKDLLIKLGFVNELFYAGKNGKIILRLTNLIDLI